MQPRAVLVRRRRDRVERVARAGVDLARLRADDRRAVARGERASRARRRASRPGRRPRSAPRRRRRSRRSAARRAATRGPARRRARGRPARRSARPPRRPIPTRASTAWRAAARPVKFDVVAPVANPTAASAGRPSASSTQRSVTVSIAAAAGELVRREAVLIPRRREPVGRQRGGQDAAGDEPEVARAGARDGRRPGDGGEPLDHRDRVLAVLGQRLVERRDQRPRTRAMAPTCRSPIPARCSSARSAARRSELIAPAARPSRPRRPGRGGGRTTARDRRTCRCRRCRGTCRSAACGAPITSSVANEVEVVRDRQPVGEVADVRDEVDEPPEQRHDQALLLRLHRSGRRRDLVGGADQARPEHLLDLADLRPVGARDVVRGARVEPLAGLDPQQLDRLRLVREEPDVLLELEPRLLDEAEGRLALRQQELVPVDRPS